LSSDGRLKSFSILLSTENTPADPSLLSSDWSVLHTQETVQDGDLRRNLIAVQSARHFAIFSSSNNGLSMREVEIFGFAPVNCEFNACTLFL